MGTGILSSEDLGKAISAKFFYISMSNYPGIEAQKAGTSGLYENPKEHPEIYLSDQKESHYFDNGLKDSLYSYS